MGDPFMATGFGELKVFSGSAHPELTREIAAFLGVSMGQSRLRRFPDSEVSFQICLLYTNPSPRDNAASRMPSSA
jgi:hypothetical protein